METKFSYFSMFLVFLLNTLYSLAQQEIVVSDSAVDGSIKFALVQKLSKTAQAEDPKTLLKRVLKASPGNEFYLYKVVNDKLGMTHEKYQQAFKGIKVEFREYIVHKDKSGNIVSINGDYAKISESFNIIPKLEFIEALTKAGLTKDIGNYQILKLPIAKSFETPISKRGDNFELVIVKGYDNQYHLAYKANIAGSNIFDGFYGYLDSETGELVFKQKLIYHSNTTGSAATLYAGSRTITTDSYPSGYRLRETSRGGTNTPIETYNFNRAPAYYVSDVDNGIVNASDFSDNDNNWTVAEHDINFDRASLDAHWGAEMTFDYFKTLHSRNSHDGNNGLIKSFVHVRTRNDIGNPIDMDNAFWLESHMAMFYGDGIYFEPTVSLDICAHELGHAVCNGSVGASREGLVYTKESGALNESLSDIWGACVEQWATSGKQTWLLGEDVFYGGLRSMSNPNDFYHPDTYQGTNWVNTECGTPSDENDNCGVHTNSGVGNYWFYLLSQGGTGTNDIGNPYNVTGIGITDAARIVYRMEDIYLNPTNGFYEARSASIQSAIDTYGVNSCKVIAVTNAWYAVGVGEPFQYQGEIIGNVRICSSGSTYTIENLPALCTVTWNCGPNLTIVSQQGSACTIQANSYGASWVKATVNLGCCTIDIEKEVSASTPPSQPAISIPSEPINCEYNALAWATATPEDVIFNWQINRGAIVSLDNEEILVKADCPPKKTWFMTLAVSAENACGTTSYTSRLIEVQKGGGVNPTSIDPIVSTIQNRTDIVDSTIVTNNNSILKTTSSLKTTSIIKKDYPQFSIKPNPAYSQIEIIQVNPENAISPDSPIKLSIYNNLGNIIVNKTFTSTTCRIDVAGLTPGIYTVKIVKNNLTSIQRFIKE